MDTTRPPAADRATAQKAYEAARRAANAEQKRRKAVMLLLEPAAKTHGSQSAAYRRWAEASDSYCDALRAWRSLAC